MKRLHTLELVPAAGREAELIEGFIKQNAPVNGVMQILEAGCGQRWSLQLEEVQYFLTGVDVDPQALAIRKNVMKDLDEAIVGDLRTVVFSAGRFDVIYNAYVLEHILGAEGVLQ